jgi:hypothetical protein
MTTAWLIVHFLTAILEPEPPLRHNS